MLRQDQPDSPPGMLAMRRIRTDGQPTSNHFDDFKLHDDMPLPVLQHHATLNTFEMDLPNMFDLTHTIQDDNGFPDLLPTTALNTSVSNSSSKKKSESKSKHHLSFGTTFHDMETCSPCRFEWTRGCHMGVQCRFCHHEDHTPPGAFRVQCDISKPAPNPPNRHNNAHGSKHNNNSSITTVAPPPAVNGKTSQPSLMSTSLSRTNSHNETVFAKQQSNIITTSNELLNILPRCECGGNDPNCIPLAQLSSLSSYLSNLVARLSSVHSASSASQAAAMMMMGIPPSSSAHNPSYGNNLHHSHHPNPHHHHHHNPHNPIHHSHHGGHIHGYPKMAGHLKDQEWSLQSISSNKKLNRNDSGAVGSKPKHSCDK